MRWSRGLPYRFRRTRAKSARWRAPRAGPGRGLARVGGKSAVRSARRRRMHAPTTRTPDRRFRRFRFFPPRRAANPPARAPCHTHPTLTCRKKSPLGARECDTLHVTLTSHSRAEKSRRLGRLGVAFGRGVGLAAPGPGAPRSAPGGRRRRRRRVLRPFGGGNGPPSKSRSGLIRAPRIAESQRA